MKSIPILCLGIALASSCASPDIVIGFSGSVSGKDYSLGVEGRNAALLFADQVNAAGGIGGRKLAFLFEDHASDPSRVAPATERLADSGAIAIFGYFTSARAELALPVGLERGIALVSPTATSSALSGKRDAFFRTVMSSKRDAEALAARMRARGHRSILVIHTLANAAYVDTYLVPLRSLVAVAGEVAYSSVAAVDWDSIAAAPPHDATLIVANAIDTATIAQSMYAKGLSKPLYVSGWAGNDELVETGGVAVEGATFVHQVDMAAALSSPFAAEYRARYGETPGFAAVEAWDALQLIKLALETGARDRVSFLRAISSIRGLRGLCGEIAIDEYGDAHRHLFYRSIVNGQIVSDGEFE
jgi:branched-chain amino acid transport system substrate-binding protein